MNNKEVLDRTFNKILNYINDLNTDGHQVAKYLPPEKLKSEIDLNITQDGVDYDKLFDFIDKYIKYGVKTGSKQYFNQLFSGFNLPAFIGEIFTSLTNTSMYTYEVAPVASLIEAEIVNKMLGYVGFEQGEGIFLTGGSNANLVAMFSARNRMMPSSRKDGITGQKTMTAFVSDQSHYSFATAGNLVGIGSANVILVKSDSEGRMMHSDLEDKILASIERGELPFFVAATAGTTMLGAFDSIVEIEKITKKYNIWLHVDGSFGASLILSNQFKHLFEGLPLADSFVWNPHKLMNIPHTCSVLLVNKKNTLKSNLTDLRADYIFHSQTFDFEDIGESSLQCGRRVDAFKLWLAWMFYGDKGYAERMDKVHELAIYFENKVKAHDKLELLVNRQTLTVCFRYIPDNQSNLDEVNIALRTKLRNTGKSMVNYGYVSGVATFRWVILNPDVDFADIDCFFDNLNAEIETL